MGKRLESTPRSRVRADANIPKRNLTGWRSGRLTVIRFSHMDANGHGSIWECKCDCGNTHFSRGTHLAQSKTLSCGCLRREMFDRWREDKHGDKNPQWKGGKINVDGYIKIITPFKDRFGKPRYKFEHRAVMEQFIERPLESHEAVHHKNGIKTDNRIENLELMTSLIHRGEVTCPHCQNKFNIR